MTTKSNSTAVRGHFFKIYINIILSVKGLAWVAEIRKNKENEKKAIGQGHPQSRDGQREPSACNYDNAKVNTNAHCTVHGSGARAVGLPGREKNI